MPFFHRDLAHVLCDAMETGIDAVVPRTADGRCHPLCGVYGKHLGPVFQGHLERGCYKLQDALKTLRVRSVYVTGRLERCLENINTPGDYRRCCRDGSPDGGEGEEPLRRVN